MIYLQYIDKELYIYININKYNRAIPDNNYNYNTSSESLY